MRLFALIILFSACLIGCQSVDASDRRALREQCSIPEYAELVSYKGFPSTNGFGQREGLEVSGKFKIKSSEVVKFEKTAQWDGWEPLPIANTIRSKIRFKGMAINLDLEDGLYRCRTAGDNVLYTSVSKPCAEVEKLNDIMISVFDRKSNEFSAVVRSGY